LRSQGFCPIKKDPEVEHLKLCQKLVAVENGQVIGFVGVHESYPSWLYVHPDHYGRGMGRTFLQVGPKLIHEKAWTIVLAGNSRAIHLYQSKGFVEVNRYQSDNAGYPCICLRLEPEI